MARPGHAWWTPYFIASASFLLSVAAALGFSRLLEERNETRFGDAIEVTRERVERRVVRYLDVLRGTRGLLLVDPDLTRGELRTYLGALDVEERFPGLLGVGYGSPGSDFVWEPIDPTRRSVVPEWTEPAQHEAMNDARDTGNAAVSARFTLSEEREPANRGGFWIYLPLYRPGAVTRSLAERRAAFAGFVLAAVRATDLFADLVDHDRPPHIVFDVYDTERPSSANLLHRSRVTADDEDVSRWRRSETVHACGRSWTVVFRALPTFQQISGQGAARYVFIAGMFVTFVLFWVSRGQTKAHAEAESQRKNLHDLFMSVPAAIAILRGPEHRYELSNPVNRMWAFGRNLVGKTVREGMPELAAQGFVTLLDQVYRTGERIASSEVPFVSEVNGTTETMYLSGVYQPVRGATGQVEGILSFAYEVTEQVLARQRVEEARTTVEEALVVLDTVFETAPIGMAFFDRDLYYVRVNTVLANMSGVPAERAVGRRLGEVAPGLAGKVEALIRRVLETGEPILGVEIAGTTAAAPTDERHWEASYFPVRDAKGRVFLVGALVSDITERKRAQEERERLLAELRSAVKMRDDFLAIAGHELKTPLAALLLQIQGLTRQALRESSHGVPLRFVERLDKASHHVARLEALIKNLLDVSRISEGRMQLQLEPLELTMLVNDVVERLGDQLERAGCGVIVEAPERVTGQWDRVRLDQVLINLVTNAMKYGAGQRIEIRVSQNGRRARLDVRDHGIGISAEDAGRIFGRFERAVSEHHYGGFGLGLWISREIVQQLGGTIDFESTLGKGTTFSVELPLERMETTS